MQNPAVVHVIVHSRGSAYLLCYLCTPLDFFSGGNVVRAREMFGKAPSERKRSLDIFSPKTCFRNRQLQSEMLLRSMVAVLGPRTTP